MGDLGVDGIHGRIGYKVRIITSPEKGGL